MSKQVLNVVREIFSWIEFIILMALVFYAGFLHGQKSNAVEVQQKANQWMTDNCDSINGTPIKKVNAWQILNLSPSSKQMTSN